MANEPAADVSAAANAGGFGVSGQAGQNGMPQRPRSGMGMSSIPRRPATQGFVANNQNE